MDQVKFFIDVLEKEPPYKEVEITLQDYENLSRCRELKIENFCTACQKKRVFANHNMDTSFYSLQSELNKHRASGHRMSINPALTKTDDVLPYECCFITFSVFCSFCEEEHFYALKINSNSICKIGQYPSFSCESVSSLQKYKNIISKYYIELTSAVNVNSQGKGIGSFVYLRRILEHLVNIKYSKLSDTKEDIKFVDKLHAVEEKEVIIPEPLNKIKNQIYSILSKGVHEYSDEECLKLFPAVLFVIIEILDNEFNKKEKKKREADVTEIIKAALGK